MVGVEIQFSDLADLLRSTYTPRQVRIYAVIDRVRWGRGRLKPWTLRALFSRLLSRYTHYYEWRFQMLWEANLKMQAQRIADKIDAEAALAMYGDSVR